MPSGGPAGPGRDPALVLASSTFNSGIILLPPELQADARRLYYLLRTIDDLVDENDPQAESRVEAIERWAQGLESDSPEIATLIGLSTRYPLPSQAFIDFCKGMRQDLERTTIETEEDLELYCQYVGGAVGVMLATLLGTSDPAAEELMALLGTAMQRTNILRDIDEDLAHGRLYIARSTIERFGFPAPGSREKLIRDQIARADSLYEQGFAAMPLLSNGRLAMELAATLYREILRQIEREGFGRRAGRAMVPAWRRRMLTAEHRLRAAWRDRAPAR